MLVIIGYKSKIIFLKILYFQYPTCASVENHPWLSTEKSFNVRRKPAPLRTIVISDSIIGRRFAVRGKVRTHNSKWQLGEVVISLHRCNEK